MAVDEKANNQKEEEKNSGDELQTPQPEQSEKELLTQKIEELEKQTAQLKDQLLRKAAEFENYKQRSRNDYMALTKYAGESTITLLLPTLDDFSRSLKSGKEKLEQDPFYKGVEMIYTKFVKTLEGQGLKTLDCAGKEFKVEFHDALMQVQRADIPPHTIIEEVEKGYELNGKVIRHAKVVVSAAPEVEQPDATKESNN